VTFDAVLTGTEVKQRQLSRLNDELVPRWYHMLKVAKLQSKGAFPNFVQQFVCLAYQLTLHLLQYKQVLLDSGD
jgi:hypothetical protein